MTFNCRKTCLWKMLSSIVPARDPQLPIMDLLYKQTHNAELEKTPGMRKRCLRRKCLLEMQTL